MYAIKAALIVAFGLAIGVLGFTAGAQALEAQQVLGRGKVVTFPIPAGTSGFTLLLEGDGTATLPDAYGQFVKDADGSTNQAHFGASEESTESISIAIQVTAPSSRDVSTLTLVLDQEEMSGTDLPKVGSGLQWTHGTHPTLSHSAFASNFRLEKSVGVNSNIVLTNEFEYAGERLNGESARWSKTGSSQDEIRIWTGMAGRPRLGLRWGLEGGFAFNPMGSNIATMPLGLRLGFLKPIEPGNWLETASRTQAMVGLTSVSLSEELGADAAWYRWGGKLGSLALTAGTGLEARYESGINAAIVPRLGIQWSTVKAGTLRLRLGFAIGDRPGPRLEVGLQP